MIVRNPEDIHGIFEKAFNAGDMEGMLSLYEPKATLVPQPGMSVTGHEQIRAALTQFLALKATMKIQTAYATVTGDLALLRGDWQLTGGAMDMKGSASEVLRKQPDGRWLYVIDLPFGAG